MQFQFPLQKALQTNQNGISVISAQNSRRNCYLDEVIDKMGEASAIAQQLKQIITTANKFYGSDQRIYMKADGKNCQGLLKVGKKNLFYRDYCGSIKELQPLCVLDFYVHESVQRMGVGKELFEEMLKNEQIKPEKLAYDRPSQKLMGFLNKHYHLNQYVPQNNNFVIFNQYFGQGNQSNVQGKSQKYSRNSQIDQLDIMMQQITKNKMNQQQLPQQKLGYQMNPPWAIDNNTNIYNNNINSQRTNVYKIN
ncbi:unnamed protein product [Paramecium pentaurelia]|uniref:Alpha-tubulin N-acetyltransferase n=1 Tax=Paramecium pentaurelia TaxID=43138 RepID=A0A8S1Y2M6_9CILI|nr:unnamed protein product [Paramecium pentaurelia]